MGGTDKILIFVCIAEQQDVMPRKFENLNQYNLDYQFLIYESAFSYLDKTVIICLFSEGLPAPTACAQLSRVVRTTP